MIYSNLVLFCLGVRKEGKCILLAFDNNQNYTPVIVDI